MPVVVTAYGSATATVPGNLTAGATYCIVPTSVAGSGTATGTFQLAPTSGGACSSPGATIASFTTPGVGTFAIGPPNMNVAAQGKVWSPMASVCTSCHDSEEAARHMIDMGNPAFSSVPLAQGPGTSPSAFVDHIRPYTTTLTKGSLTDAQGASYLGNQAAGYGLGIETCVGCHGPGGIADVSAVHENLSFGP